VPRNAEVRPTGRGGTQEESLGLVDVDVNVN
jgi:hypothetical protein